MESYWIFDGVSKLLPTYCVVLVLFQTQYLKSWFLVWQFIDKYSKSTIQFDTHTVHTHYTHSYIHTRAHIHAPTNSPYSCTHIYASGQVIKHDK